MKKEDMQVIGFIAAIGAILLGYRYFNKTKASGSALSDVSPTGPVSGVGAPVGYGYDASRNVYAWIGQGLPPGGKYTLPLI